MVPALAESVSQSRDPASPTPRRANSGADPSEPQSAPEMTENEDKDIRAELVRLRQEHRDLDFAIDALESSGRGDHLTIQRLKKKKLAIKDRITHLEDSLVPDIIA